MTKGELRTEFLNRRKALSAEEVEQRSRAIAEQFFRGLVAPEKKLPFALHTFLPIVRHNEVNTWLIIHQIWLNYPHITVTVSVTNQISRTLIHYELTPETPLIENSWGIPEPVGSERSVVSSKQIDMVLVPLLAFSRNGHRIGYGGGYYDSFLAECRPDCLKAGLSLFEPVDQIDEVEATDVRLDVCVTPQRIVTF